MSIIFNHYFSIVVCDNVHRTLSRYLHIQKHATNKLGELGATLVQFDERLFRAAKHFATFLNRVKKNEGYGTMDGTFVNTVYKHFKPREPEMSLNETSTLLYK